MLKVCPRCNALALEEASDHYGEYVDCFMCGYHGALAEQVSQTQLARDDHMERAVDGSMKKRWSEGAIRRRLARG